MSDSLISVVIPSYNYGHFVCAAVESALVQTYPHREVIVVDDGSTDDTRGRLAPYLNRIRYIRQDNGGLSAARNTGIRAAGGEWIALLDADDVWHPRKLELQMQCLRMQSPEVGLLATNSFTDQRSDWPAVDDAPAQVVHYALEEVLGSCFFGPSSALIRRACLEQVGLFDPSLRSVEDRDMWIRLATCCSLAKLSLPLIFYRIHAASLSNKCFQMEENELRVLAKAFAQIPALAGRWSLRRNTYSLAAFTSAQVFRGNGYLFAAMQRMLRSFLYWPLPLRNTGKNGGCCLRARVTLNLLLRLLKLREPEKKIDELAVAVPPPLPALPEQEVYVADSQPVEGSRVLANVAQATVV